MKKSERFSIRNRIRSFSFALNGIVSLIKNEHNARVHLALMVAVVILGFLVKLDRDDWLLIIFAAGLVFITELINTAVERLADVVRPEWDDKIRLIKDYSAGAVLIAAIVAVALGTIIFVPELINLWSQL